MTAFTARIETSIAVVERDDQGLIQVRIRPATTLTIVAIAEILEARRRLSEGQPRLVLFVFPPEDVDFELSMITLDHYRTVPVEQFTRAVAWVTRNSRNDQFCKLYFAYFPSPVPSAIFEEESAARGWLQQFMPAPSTGR